VIIDAKIDTAAVLRAPDADKIAIALAYREHYDMNNAPPLRDE